MAGKLPQNNEDWIKSGNNTYVNPSGSSEIAWSKAAATPNKNAAGQTISQGTYEADKGDGSYYAVYDGAQNYIGSVLGDGSFYHSGDNAALQAAKDQIIARGGALDGKTTAADYEAAVATGKQASRDAFNESGKSLGYDDKSDPLEELYAAQERAAVAALEKAYKGSIIELDAAKEKIPGYYYDAENQVAGDNARQKQNMNEQFAALGLNTGAQGQMAAAQSNVYQGNISKLENSKAQALADIETQRAKLTAEYKSAVAEAIANNEISKAQALYSEYVRQDEAAQSAAASIQAMQASAASESQSLAQAQVDAILAAGGAPSAELTAQAGYSMEYVSALREAMAQELYGDGYMLSHQIGAQTLFEDVSRTKNPLEYIYANYSGYGMKYVDRLCSAYSNWLKEQGQLGSVDAENLDSADVYSVLSDMREQGAAREKTRQVLQETSEWMPAGEYAILEKIYG